MKYVTLPLVFLIISTSSCRRENTCYCIVDDHGVVIDSTTITVWGGERAAKRKCDQYEDVYTPSLIPEAKTHCEIK